MKRWIRKKAIRYITKNLFNAITEEDVLRMGEKGGIIYKGRTLSKEEVGALKSEADFLQKSIVLKLLLEDMRYLANQTIYEKSTSFDDVMFGKAQLFVVDVLKKKIKNLSGQ